MTDDANDTQKLKDKVSQLIEEKRKVQAERDELRSQVEALMGERDHAKNELTRITIDQPRAELLEAVAVDGMADVLRRELEHHFDIVRGEDGRDWFQTKDGEPVTIENTPVEFTAEGVHALYEKAGVKIGSMIKGSGAAGGGARGGSRNGYTPSPAKTTTRPNDSFGLR